MSPVITIDGPTASGKGTIAQEVASLLGFHFLDSGVLYRLTALAAREHGVAPSEETKLAQLARGLEIRFDKGDVFYFGVPVTEEIRSEEVGNLASAIAVLPKVRAALVERQRAFRSAPGLVADGRDMGTVIFPDAVLKVFLTASVEVRAERRTKQLMEKGIFANIATLLQDLRQRDARDVTRAISPLVAAPDAVIVDSTDLSVEQVVSRIIELAATHGIVSCNGK